MFGYFHDEKGFTAKASLWPFLPIAGDQDSERQDLRTGCVSYVFRWRHVFAPRLEWAERDDWELGWLHKSLLLNWAVQSNKKDDIWSLYVAEVIDKGQNDSWSGNIVTTWKHVRAGIEPKSWTNSRLHVLCGPNTDLETSISQHKRHCTTVMYKPGCRPKSDQSLNIHKGTLNKSGNWVWGRIKM